MHISDKIANELTTQGFTFANGQFEKTFATGGQYGRQKKYLRIHATGRWLLRVDGWGETMKDADLRNFDNAQSAIDFILS